MITDGRYFLRQHSPTQLWRYDRRWKRANYFEPRGGEAFTVVEGADALLVQSGDSSKLELSVHSFQNPNVPVARGTFQMSKWTFEGDAQAWTRVPEYVLVPFSTKRKGLLRIADDATIDTLGDLPAPASIMHVPDSRLLVIAGAGFLVIYDPAAKNAGFKMQLAERTPDPTLRFRGSAELWLDDGTTLMKLETRNWTVIDAAGSHGLDEDDDAPAITAWTFSPDQSHVLVVRDGLDDVLVLQPETLTPIATFMLKRPAVDIAEAPDGKLIAVDADGKLPRSHRIDIIHTEPLPAPREPEPPASSFTVLDSPDGEDSDRS